MENYGREGEKYQRDPDKNSEEDQREGRRFRVNDSRGDVRDSKNNTHNADSIGGGIFHHDYLAAVELPVPNPGLGSRGNGFEEKTVRDVKINCDIVKFMLFVV